ncbi:hypothetical protein WJX74_009254 [Apatococcus lobatus]|uniref:Peptidoglycan binding-like domain-containing protein n=2 Tax=Apatococcus TaxID=904362 RepID=A0AAW1SS40_9CHLO
MPRAGVLVGRVCRLPPVLIRNVKTCAAMRSSGDEDLTAARDDLYDSAQELQTHRLEAREDSLWERQERIWDREVRRWDEERQKWDIREQALQQRIQTLEAEYIRLVSLLVPRTDSGSQPAARAPVPDLANSPSEALAMRSLEDGLRQDVASGNAELTSTGSGRKSSQIEAAHVPEALPNTFSNGAQEQVASPSGPPPVLKAGDEDMYWVNLLQTKLLELGYSCGDEEVDDMIFGDATQSALATLQACEGLPESGVADQATWARILGDEYSETASAPSAEPDDLASSSNTAARLAETGSSPLDGHVEAVPSSIAASTPAAIPLKKWPMLREGDGGRTVHGLQVALDRMGFNPGREDMQWWQFGDSTYGALQTMQACSHLPDTGVADEATWKALLGADAQPNDILLLYSEDENDTDMTETSADRGVWLVGEQRFSKRRA